MFKSVSGEGENIFEIDAIQGIIKIRNSPDYETMNKYNLTVTAVNNKSAPFYQVRDHYCNEQQHFRVDFELLGGRSIPAIYCVE